jgi:hypothetical protein
MNSLHGFTGRLLLVATLLLLAHAAHASSFTAGNIVAYHCSGTVPLP